nr:hypothetical protein [Tanacetum cinerariifolium]
VSTHDDEDKEEESFDPVFQTPSHDEKTDDEDIHGMNVEGDEMDDEGANEVDDTNELYRDMNINLEGPDIQMADDQTTQVIEYTHVTLTSVNPEDDDDQNDDDDEQTDLDNDDDDFIHPKVSTHDDEDKEEESFDPVFQTPSHDEKTDDEDIHGMNVEGDEMDDEGANEVDDTNELYRDMNINLEGPDIQMADDQTTQVIEYTHVTLTSVNPEGQQQSSFVSS